MAALLLRCLIIYGVDVCAVGDALGALVGAAAVALALVLAKDS
jgi:hypothetical protein